MMADERAGVVLEAALPETLGAGAEQLGFERLDQLGACEALGGRRPDGIELRKHGM